MANLTVQIVTFNDNEADAIDALFNDLATFPSTWSRSGPTGLTLTAPKGRLDLTHTPLYAQGNVIAAAKLADIFSGKSRPADLVVFYGCAGAVSPSLVGSAFLVSQVSYASLGTVASSAGTPGTAPREVTTLKNKWLCHTDPHEVNPLASIAFALVAGPWLIDLQAATLLSPAHVVATDKVVKVGPAAAAPTVKRPGPPHPVYTKTDWTYAETLAFVQQQVTGLPVLVEMESFGIGSIATALKCVDHIVIIRVVTDDLVGHASSPQRPLLMKGRAAVAALVGAVLKTALGV